MISLYFHYILIKYIINTTINKVARLPKHTKVRELLIALNKIHFFDRIQNVYKSIFTKLENEI